MTVKSILKAVRMRPWAVVKDLLRFALWLLMVAFFLALWFEGTGSKPASNPCMPTPDGNYDCPDPPDHEWQVP